MSSKWHHVRRAEQWGESGCERNVTSRQYSQATFLSLQALQHATLSLDLGTGGRTIALEDKDEGIADDADGGPGNRAKGKGICSIAACPGPPAMGGQGGIGGTGRGLGGTGAGRDLHAAEGRACCLLDFAPP